MLPQGELQKCSISLCGSSVRGRWRGAPLLGTLKYMYRKALEMGISHKGPIGEPGRGLIYQRLWKIEGSGNGASLSVGALWGEPGGGDLLYWGPWRVCKGRLWKWASVSIRSPFLGTWGDAPLLWPLRNGWVFLSEEFLLRNLRYMLNNALETGISLHRGPHWRAWRGFIYWDFWEADAEGL